MSMQKTMILPACLGILLVGIVMIPGVFAGDGCGTGTVLVDGVCQLAPQESMMDVVQEQSWLMEYASLTNHQEVQFHHCISQEAQPQ